MQHSIFEIKGICSESDVSKDTIFKIVDELSYRKTQAADKLRKEIALRFKIKGEVRKKQPINNLKIRWYKGKNIDQLEKLFKANVKKISKKGRKVLTQIDHELTFRNTRKSRKLAEDVLIARHLNKRQKKKSLNEKDQAIMRMRKLGHTLEDIGEEFDLSRQRIHQIFKRLENNGHWEEDIKSIKAELKNADLKKELNFLTVNQKNLIFKDYKKGLSDQTLIKTHKLSKKLLQLLIDTEIQNGSLDRRFKVFNPITYERQQKLFKRVSQLIDSNYSRTEIASMLKVSPAMVSTYFQVMRNRGYATPSIKGEFSQLELIEYRSMIITQMNNNKKTKKEIALILGITPHGIQRHINLYLTDY